MISITPSLRFSGRCEEAIHLYKRVFNAKIDGWMRYSDADGGDPSGR